MWGLVVFLFVVEIQQFSPYRCVDDGDIMDDIQTFFDKYIHLPSEISGKNDHAYTVLILLSVISILLLLICNLCICSFIRRRRRRELIDYPSNTLQYIPFPRNIRKPYHAESNTSSTNRMIPPPRHQV